MLLIANKLVNVNIGSDRLGVALSVNADAAGRSPVTAKQIMDELAGLKIVVDNQARASVEAFVAALNKQENPEAIIVARGTPARDARSGRVEKLYKEPDEQTQADGNSSSYYDRTKYIVASQGQQVLRILPPEEGADGMDVYGRSIPHKRGHLAHVTLGPNVKQEGEYVIAACNGIVNHIGERISISPKLEIKDNVDFSTGNVYFPGEVEIGKNVLDKFKVQSDSSITVGGVVEAAHVQAGGDLIVAGGMAGKEKGVFAAGKNIRTKYITNAQVRAGGNIDVHSEIVNCDLACEGRLSVENGPLVGGHALAVGGVKVRELGAAVGTRTLLEVGIDPGLRQRYDQLAPEIKTRRHKAGKTRQIVEPLLRNQKHLSHEQKEKATELLYQASELEAETKNFIDELRELYVKAKEKAVLEVEIIGTAFPGVIIRFPKIEAHLTAALSGPLKIMPKKVDGALQVTAIDSNFKTSMILASSADAGGFWEDLEELLGLPKF